MIQEALASLPSRAELFGLKPAPAPGHLPSLRSAFALAVVAATLWLSAQIFIRTHGPIWNLHVDDEFSVLLEADTFLHGRLTNPPHPLARFWESPHVIITPTYASKYPPATAAWLAAGKLLFGTYYNGILLQDFFVVLMLPLTLCAWTSLRVSALLTFITGCCMLRPVTVWANSYYGGGAVAIMGSFCVLWGLGWFIHTRQKVAPGIVMAAGAVQLYFSRPYEGGVLCLAVLGYIIWATRRMQLPVARTLLRLALFAAPVLLFGLIFTLYYNQRVTGSIFEDPYVLHQHEYLSAPAFCFLPMKPKPHLSNARLDAVEGMHGWEARGFAEACYRPHWFLHTLWLTFKQLWLLSVPLALLLPLLPLAWRDFRVRALAVVASACILCVALEAWQTDRYVTPAFAALVVLLACATAAASEHAAINSTLRRIFVLELLGLLTVFMLHEYRNDQLFYVANVFGAQRAEVVNKLSRASGPQLVVVHYKDPSACDDQEWVYNGADPDHEKVIFAHDLGPAQNHTLFDYYRNRTKWLLTATSCTSYNLQRLQ